MPAGHHTLGLSSGTAKLSVFVWFAARSTAWLTGAPAAVPATVACTAADVSLRTSVFTVRSAWFNAGTASFVSTCVLRSATLAERRTTTSRRMPRLWSGVVCTQSIQPIVRFLFGSFGYTLNATLLVPACSAEVRSSSKCGYTPATVDFVATWVPLTQTSAADSTPLKSSTVRRPVSLPSVRSARYHHGTLKSLAGMDFMLVEKNGSAYLPLASRPARTVERAAVGYHPVVEKPGLETALSSETLLDDWMRNPGIAAAPPAFAGTVSATAGGGADGGAGPRAVPAAPPHPGGGGGGCPRDQGPGAGVLGFLRGPPLFSRPR